MNMREKMARAMTAIQSSCGRELTCRGAEPCSCTMDVVDAALDALMGPTDDVMAEGYNAAYAADTGVDEMAEVVVEHAYVAMIRAIKEGK